MSELEQRIYLYPKNGSLDGNSVVEVAIRPSLLMVRGKSNLVIRRLTFEHASSPVQKSAVTFHMVKNLLFEDSRVRWNNWVGYQLSEVENVTSLRNTMNFNGGSGVIGGKIKSLLSEDENTSHNNWRGALANFHFWAVAGAKYLHLHDAVFRRHKAESNQAGGFWLDTDNKNIQIENSTWCGNLKYGLFIEASQGPITLSHSKIYQNQWLGVHIMTSENAAFENNFIFENPVGIIVEKKSKRTIKNWETDQLHNLETGDWTLKKNVIASQKVPLIVGTRNFLSTLTSNENHWYRPVKTNMLMIEESQLPRQFFSFSDWKSIWGHDQNTTNDLPLKPTIPPHQECAYERVPDWAHSQHTD